MIGIIDCGLGNLRSVYNAIYENGFDPEYVSDPIAVNDYSHIVLPGVGSFQSAMGKINTLGFSMALCEHVQQGKPLLGICLGMQLLASLGDEGAAESQGPVEGLGLIPGRVTRLAVEEQLRVPHVGWNTVSWKKSHPVLAEIKPERDFYFVHSYAMKCVEEQDVLAGTDYGGAVTCAVAKGSAVGFQFHPEKSQRNGMKLLENFCDWDGQC